jgi:hypothetical protein
LREDLGKALLHFDAGLLKHLFFSSFLTLCREDGPNPERLPVPEEGNPLGICHFNLRPLYKL